MWNELRHPCAGSSDAPAPIMTEGRVRFRSLTRLSWRVFVCALLVTHVPIGAQGRAEGDRSHSSGTDEPAPTTSPAGAKGSDKSKTKAPVHRREARIVLGDGRIVRGVALFRSEKQITLQHHSGGVAYSKRFDVSEIETIRVRQWRARFVRRAKQGEIFHLEPYEFEVRLKSGATLTRKGSFLPFLKQFPIENDNGRVMLFTFWIDLKRPDGSWYTGMQGSERTEGHKDVVRLIEFVKPRPETDPDPD